MMLKKNVPEGKEEWQLVKCPNCGNWCWRTPRVVEVEKAGTIALCTECALQRCVK